MYKELDRLLSQETTIDSWYDDGFLIAQDIMSDFSDKDWQMLSQSVLAKELDWQKKLVYCLDNQIIQEELDIINQIMCIDDEELFTMCIDTLRNFDTEVGHKYIQSHPEILDKIIEKMDSVDTVSQKIFENFLDTFVE